MPSPSPGIVQSLVSATSQGSWGAVPCSAAVQTRTPGILRLLERFSIGIDHMPRLPLLGQQHHALAGSSELRDIGPFDVLVLHQQHPGFSHSPFAPNFTLPTMVSKALVRRCSPTACCSV